MGSSEIFRCAWNRVGIHWITEHGAEENLRLRFSANDNGLLRGYGRTTNQWHSLPLCALQYSCFNANGRCKRSPGSCPGFLQTSISRIIKWEARLQSPLERHPKSLRARRSRLAMGLVVRRGQARMKRCLQIGRRKASKCLASFSCLLVSFEPSCQLTTACSHDSLRIAIGLPR